MYQREKGEAWIEVENPNNYDDTSWTLDRNPGFIHKAEEEVYLVALNPPDNIHIDPLNNADIICRDPDVARAVIRLLNGYDCRCEHDALTSENECAIRAVERARLKGIARRYFFTYSRENQQVSCNVCKGPAFVIQASTFDPDTTIALMEAHFNERHEEEDE